MRRPGVLTLLLSAAVSAAASAQTPASVARQYCVSCHNERAKAGDLVIDGAPLTDVPGHADVWEKALRKVRAGAMPPAGMPRPDAATTAGFIRSLERQLDAGSAARASHSRPDPAAYLPPDGSSAGFDNNAGAALADARANLGFQIGDGGFARTDRGTEEDAIAAIRLFLDAGADVNVVGNNGETPLHAAAARDGAQIIRYLVQRGAKLDAKDRSGRTPLDVARGVPAAAGGRGGRGGGGGQAPAPGPRREKAVAALEGLIATPSP